MTTTTTQPAEQTTAALNSLKGPITQYIADTLTGIPQINGHFIKISADLNKDDGITLELTRRRFGGDDCAVRVTLTVSEPQDIPPAPLPDTIEPRSAALLEIWAPTRPEQPLDAA